MTAAFGTKLKCIYWKWKVLSAESHLAHTKPRQHLKTAAFFLHFALGLLVKVCSYLVYLYDAVLLHTMSVKEMLNHGAVSSFFFLYKKKKSHDGKIEIKKHLLWIWNCIEIYL